MASSDRMQVVCLQCEKAQEVSRKAMSGTCRFCSKALRFEDKVYNRYEARRVVETCGTVTVNRPGSIIADRILCAALHVRGKVKGHVKSRGMVRVEAEGELKGDVTAPTFSVAAGAILEGNFTIGPARLESAETGQSEAYARPAASMS